MYFMIVFVLFKFFIGQFSEFSVLFDGDFIIFAILCYKMKRPPLFLILVFGIFKDLWLWDQFYGIATLQYIIVYLIAEQTKNFYIKQTFYMTWLHFALLNICYQIIPFLYFYITSGVVLYQKVLFLCISNVFWFPILYSIFTAKREKAALT